MPAERLRSANLRAFSLTAVLFGLCSLLTLASCGGESAGLRQTDGPAPTADSSLEGLLPAPASLIDRRGEERTVSFEPEDLVVIGANYSSTLPNNLVAGDGNNLALSPAWEAGDPFSDLAYCMYFFDAEGYNLEPLLRLDFEPALTAPTNCYVAVANWDTNRWQWFSMPASGIVNLPAGQMDSFFNFTGSMLCAVAMTGSASATLETIRLGDPLPLAVITATPDAGTLPLTVTLSAAGSSTPEGTITKHEWDYEGDGTFDFDSGMIAEIEYEYLAAGTYMPRLRITNSFGATAVDETEVVVSSSWTHSSGLETTEEYQDIAFNAEGRIFAIGGTGNGISNQELLISAWAPDGELLWTRQWDSGYHSSDGLAVEVDSDGNVIVAGYVFIGLSDFRGFVQKWSPEGELIWCNEYNDAGHKTDFTALVTDLTDIYVTGSISPAVGQGDMLTLKLGPTGVPQWQNRINLGGHEYGIDLDLNRPQGSSENALAFVGQYYDTLFSLNSALVGHLTMTGSNGVFEYITDTVNSYYAKSVVSTYNEQNMETELAVGGIIAQGGLDRNFIMIHRPGMSFPLQRIWSGADATLSHDLVRDGNGNYLMAGATPPLAGELREAAYWLFSSADATLLDANVWSGAQRPSVLKTVQPYYGGLLMAGSALNNSGSWAELSGTESSTSPILSGVNLPTSNANVAATPLAGTVSTPAMTADSGAGGSDAFIALRLQSEE